MSAEAPQSFHIDLRKVKYLPQSDRDLLRGFKSAVLNDLITPADFNQLYSQIFERNSNRTPHDSIPERKAPVPNGKYLKDSMPKTSHVTVPISKTSTVRQNHNSPVGEITHAIGATEYDLKTKDRMVFIRGRAIAKERYVAPQFDENGKAYSKFERELLEEFENNGKWYMAMAYRLLGDSHLAEEAFQEARFKAWRKRETFVPKNDKSLSTWFASIISHQAIDTLRRLGRKQIVDLGRIPETDRFASKDEESEAVERQETRSEIRKALSKIPPQYIDVLVLRYFNELSYKEIAAELGEPVSTVRMRLFRARQIVYHNPDLQRLAGKIPAETKKELLATGD